MENTMTVKELLEELGSYDENLQVMAEGLGEILTINTVNLDKERGFLIIG